jgi:predicted NBD/HSP70 family sugar kinase
MTPEHLHAGDWQHNLESVVGGRAIDRAAKLLFGPESSAAALFDAAATGDAQALEAVTQVHEYLAMATADIIALLDPAAVIFGGGVAMAQGERLLGPVRELAHASTPVRTTIVLSELGEDAQILGAVKLAIDRRRAARTPSGSSEAGAGADAPNASA